MSRLSSEVRTGFYADSIVLMQLQSRLLQLPEILDAGVVMGTPVNLDLLRSGSLLDEVGAAATAGDLVIAVRAESESAAAAAFAAVDDLLRREPASTGLDFRPHSLATAIEMMASDPTWVSISVPGRFAHRLADEALEHGAHVFLYSDNVDSDAERQLKTRAQALGRLVLGPDCGSAIIGGVGFGFTNRVRHGPVGLVCASGTGLQTVSTELHRLGSGVSHALGTGGRDLSSAIGGITTLQGLDLLAGDEATRAIVVVSKPPAAEVRVEILATAYSITKPVVVYFIGSPSPAPRIGNLHFARSLEEAAELAAALAEAPPSTRAVAPSATTLRGRYLRGLFAGGTLAQETLLTVASFLTPVHSNLAHPGVESLPDPTRSLHHTILDLGGDEYTVGRLHPMMDPQLRTSRLRQEADDPETRLVLLDVVLGRGAHPDPAAELAPIVEQIRAANGPQVVVLVVGTDSDPQNLESTCDLLDQAGATVCHHVGAACEIALETCLADRIRPTWSTDPRSLTPPRAVINVGLEQLYEDLVEQDVHTLQMDWRPPAGGDETMMALLERLKS